MPVASIEDDSAPHEVLGAELSGSLDGLQRRRQQQEHAAKERRAASPPMKAGRALRLLLLPTPRASETAKAGQETRAS